MKQLTLNLIVKRPLTPAEWLLHSVAWTAACLLGWFVLSNALFHLLDTGQAWVEVLLFGTAAAAHLLIWQKAWLTSWDTVAAKTEPLWLNLVSACWTWGLLLFQLACLALLFVYLLLALSSANSGSWNF